jgi:hypothetical protein
MQNLKKLVPAGMKEDSTWIRVLKYDWTKGRRGVKIRRGVRQGYCHPFYSAYIVNTLPVKLLKGLESSKQEDK